MDLIHEAFTRLYPQKEFPYVAEIKYSRKFKPYNARVQWRGTSLKFNLSHEWEQTDPEITLGLIQSLILKLRKDRQTTFNITLYNSFLKKLPENTPKGISDQYLEESFNRVNQKHFIDPIEQPTIQWGKSSTTKLAHYDLHTDKIIVSTIFQSSPPHLLDYVMYHEMLHKKHQFRQTGSRNHFHTNAFRQEEKMFNDAQNVEKELQSFVRSRRRKSFISSFFG